MLIALPRAVSAATLHATCDTDPLAIPERYRRLLHIFCAEHHTLGLVGGSLALAEGRALRFTATFGDACRGGPPLTPTTAFRLGSITKLFTAALAMTFVDAGQLELGASLAPLLPELAGGPDERAPAISLRDLLRHSSGLTDPPAPQLGPTDDWIFALSEAALLTAPGELWSYANAGYALVGLALTRTSDTPFTTELARRLFLPLGAAGLTADIDLALQSSPACGHLGRQGLPLDLRTDLELGAAGARWTIPAGGLVGSPSALVELVLDLFDPASSPLSAAALREILEGSAIPTHERLGEHYGLGVRRVPLRDHSVLFAHSGNTGDFAADLYFAPDRGFALALATNTGASLRATALAVLHDLLAADLRPPAPAAAPERYTGSFISPDLDLQIDHHQGHLRVTSSALALDGLLLEHRGDHRFHLPARRELGTWNFAFADDAPHATHLRLRGAVARTHGATTD